MSVQTEKKQLIQIITSICSYMMQMASAQGEQAALFRQNVGLVQANGLQYLIDQTFGTNLYNCFVSARTLPITANRVAAVRQLVTALNPTGPIATMIYDSTIQYCLTTECLFITQMTFTSSNDALNMMARMTAAFNVARDNAAERMDSATYENLTYMAGSIVNYLNNVALHLPRMVSFNFNAAWPALALANLIYQDASRWEELVAENKVVHPAFMPRSITGLNR